MVVAMKRPYVFILSAALIVGAAPSNSTPACDMPLDPLIPNSCIVVPGDLWRGAKPDSKGAGALMAKGVRTVVNLEWLHDDRNTFAYALLKDTAFHQIQYFRVTDWEPLVVLSPATVDEHVAKFIAVTRTQPKPLYVHCRQGQNRTGVMVASYRIFNGMSVDSAIAEMKRFDGTWFPKDSAYIRTLTPERRQALETKIATWIPKITPNAIITCESGKCSVASK